MVWGRWWVVAIVTDSLAICLDFVERGHWKVKRETARLQWSKQVKKRCNFTKKCFPHYLQLLWATFRIDCSFIMCAYQFLQNKDDVHSSKLRKNILVDDDIFVIVHTFHVHPLFTPSQTTLAQYMNIYVCESCTIRHKRQTNLKNKARSGNLHRCRHVVGGVYNGIDS